MQTQRVQTPYGVLEISVWVDNGHLYRHPAGTVRVRTPEAYWKPAPGNEEADGEFIPGEYMTIDHMKDLRIDLLVHPDGTTQDYGMQGYNIFYPLTDHPRGTIRYPEGEDLAKVLQVAVDAAASVRDEQFMLAAKRAVAMEAHFSASKNLHFARMDLESAEKQLKKALKEGQALGLEEHMAAQERELEKYRK